MPKPRDEKYVEQLGLIRRWRWMAKKYRGRARIILDKKGLWAATEALTLDARAFILEQCARDLWRHLQGREVWPESEETKEMRTALDDLKKQMTEMHAEIDLNRQIHAAGREIEEREADDA